MRKYLFGALCALLIHCNLGAVYAFSLYKSEVASLIGGSVEWAFSLAIFFLGMSAAFAGRFVEKHVKLSVFTVACIYFLGMCLSVYAINIQSIPLFLVAYGAIHGIALGWGYVGPIKTLMLWFNHHKGLGTGIVVAGFGLAKVIYTPYIMYCLDTVGVQYLLVSMGAIGFLCMLVASLLIRKPSWWVEPKSSFSWSDYKSVLTNRTWLRVWFTFFLNITCGLALISYERQLAEWSSITWIGTLSIITALANTLGRFGYANLSDYIPRVHTVVIILATSAVACLLHSVLPLVVLLIVVNLGYGGYFSTLPCLLSDRFGMDKVSTIHGLTLSAWGFAGLCGNQLTNCILSFGGDFSTVIYVVCALYGVATILISRIKV